MRLTDGWKYKRALACLPPTGGAPAFQNIPTGNYNGMIAPLHKLAIKGVVWYQGESNAGEPSGYSEKLVKLITDWRNNWQQDDLPFIFAQLPNWAPKGRVTNWALLRDEQAKTLAVPNTRMAVTYDTGEYNDLHPLNKKAVGERLANEALSLVYGMAIVSTSPTLKTVEKVDNKIVLDFETYGSVLTLKFGEHVYGLAIWHNEIEITAEGVLDGSKVTITTPFMDEITAVSYAWSDDPVTANLANNEGLPTAPFKKELS
jgi:sialate O-acetylesterase